MTFHPQLFRFNRKRAIYLGNREPKTIRNMRITRGLLSSGDFVGFSHGMRNSVLNRTGWVVIFVESAKIIVALNLIYFSNSNGVMVAHSRSEQFSDGEDFGWVNFMKAIQFHWISAGAWRHRLITVDLENLMVDLRGFTRQQIREFRSNVFFFSPCSHDFSLASTDQLNRIQ